MSDSSPEPELNWQDEAQAVIQDVREFVKDISVADKLESNDRMIYLNITTLEGQEVCVQLTAVGFRVVGRTHNDVASEGERWFDTPYSLLASVSPEYNSKFAESLIEKLQNISHDN
ncbi:hypothetical protein AAG570_006894 [Ranatra chinensis]|uniref:GSKIP domain-containing protein n=1 Tax=Ranatra chinensis TaxID=642074 RepID=A0ABD0Z5X5_9HEMI